MLHLGHFHTISGRFLHRVEQPALSKHACAAQTCDRLHASATNLMTRKVTCEIMSGTSPSRVDLARYASMPRPLPLLPSGLPRLLPVLLSCLENESLPEPAVVSCACGDWGTLEACFSALLAQGRNAALARLISSASSSCRNQVSLPVVQW